MHRSDQVRFSSMPKGVEHARPPAPGELGYDVRFSSMPKGVEHSSHSGMPPSDLSTVRFSSMPKGVEHTIEGIRIGRNASEIFVDAERR